MAKSKVKLNEDLAGLEYMKKAHDIALECFGEESFLTQKYRMKADDIEKKMNFLLKLDQSFDYNPLKGKADPEAKTFSQDKIILH